MSCTKLWIVVVIILPAMSCQSAVRLSYPVPGDGAGNGLKYYHQVADQQQPVEPTKASGQDA